VSASDLRVTVDQPKLRCVLDPALALGHASGARLAQRLTQVFETWLPRSFWQVIDASELLRDTAAADPVALSDWIVLRDRTDAGSWLLRWVGDSLAESQLQTAGDDDLVQRFEDLAAMLLARADSFAPEHDWPRGFDPVAGAIDALALSAALEGALILSQRPHDGELPGPVRALQRLGLRAERLAPDAAGLFAAEREVVRHALAAAGLAALLQPLPPLAVVHAGVPAADGEGDPWTQSQAWWYWV
jgi:hypothetical protein